MTLYAFKCDKYACQMFFNPLFSTYQTILIARKVIFYHVFRQVFYSLNKFNINV